MFVIDTNVVSELRRPEKAAPGQWHGPVLSGYGTHLVYVHNVIEPPAPVFAEELERVTQDWRMERSEEFNEQFYANLRDQYTVVIETPPTTEDDGVQVGRAPTTGEQVAGLSEAGQ